MLEFMSICARACTARARVPMHLCLAHASDSVTESVSVCFSMLQCVVVCCSVLQHN